MYRHWIQDEYLRITLIGKGNFVLVYGTDIRIFSYDVTH